MLLRRLFPRFMSRHVRRALRGAVMVEYAFLLVAVGVPAVAGLTAGGKGPTPWFARVKFCL
jgi:Flp pilus assembly pilin Flp